MNSSTDLYETREKIQTRHVEGRFQTIRNYTRWITLSIYFVIPWLRFDGKNLILFDVHHRQFRVLWYTFWPQDFFLLVLLVLTAALALFFFTTLAGRLWCGYTCPQTVWTKIFMWIEHITEGDRNKRISLDKSKLSFEKVYKRLAKHSLWLLVAFATSMTFGGYFQPIHTLFLKLYTFQLTGWDTFWICFFTIATYLNAGWMREQLCMHICPYARIQSVMFDEETLVISYDQDRGEQRGARKKKSDYRQQGLGDCIDCHQCVYVCPTGIDIRDGLQMECIGCAACIDVCDSIMDKMGYQRGLVRYATGSSLAHKKTKIIRPRLITYGFLLISISVLLTYLLVTRIPLRLDIIRDRTHIYRETPDGLIKNNYMLKVMNMSQEDKNYTIVLNSNVKFNYIGQHQVSVKAGHIVDVPVALSIDPEMIKKSNTKILFNIKEDNNSTHSVTTETRFIAPVDN